MKVKYSDGVGNDSKLADLDEYRASVRAVVESANFSQSESSLATYADELMRSNVIKVADHFGRVSDVVLVGIGGSSLGTEAIHAALEHDITARLHVLDTVSDHKLTKLLRVLNDVPKEQLAICVISKSGSTTETLTNAEVLMTELGHLYGEVPYDRLVCIGNPDNQLLTIAKEKGAQILPMQESIGGRYSVFTTVGLLPLRLLGHDTTALLDGLSQVMREENENLAAQGASALYEQLEQGVRTVNFFVFDTRLEKLGYWYRQLAAESLGKEYDEKGNKVDIGFIPTISTPVELHSIGQLYFSGFSGVFTEFIGVEDKPINCCVSAEPIFATKYQDKCVEAIAYAIENGVVAAYEERKMPFRKTDLARFSACEIGIFMGVKMLETMYLAKLMKVNAFDQPNVELYKKKTKEILDRG